MSESSTRPSLPRLAEESSELMTLFAQAEVEYRGGIDESQAWQRLEPKLDASRRRRAWVPMLAVALVASAVALLVGWGAGTRWGWSGLRPTASVTPAARSAMPVAENGQSPEDAVVLPGGSTLLPDGSRAVVETGSLVRYRRSEQGIGLEVGRGRVELTVTRKTAGKPFSVRSPAYELRVLGTRFVVAVTERHTELSVSEGRVGVYAKERLVTVIEAGGHWSSLEGSGETWPAPKSSTTEEREPKSAASGRVLPDQTRCQEQMRGGQAQAAEQCYLTIAESGNGLSAEMAWYEVARLRRDVLGNPAGALAALEEYEHRFQGGALSPEVEMSRVDLLARLGRVNEALGASERLLTTGTGRARQCELGLMRGNLLRDQLNDCARAESEYRRCESDPGGWGDRAQMARAACLERLGRSGEAVATYEAYLKRPHPLARDKARRRLEHLRP